MAEVIFPNLSTKFVIINSKLQMQQSKKKYRGDNSMTTFRLQCE